MAKNRKLTDEDRAFLEQVRVNAERTRKLAEKAQADSTGTSRSARRRRRPALAGATAVRVTTPDFGATLWSWATFSSSQRQ